MKKEFYQQLMKKLLSVDGVQYVDLWNRNVEFIEQDTAWPMPAIFVELGSIGWKPLSGSRPDAKEYRGECDMRLHIITEWKGDSSSINEEREQCLEYLDIGSSVQSKLIDFSAGDMYRCELINSLTNHNHEDVIESIEIYRLSWDLVVLKS